MNYVFSVAEIFSRRSQVDLILSFRKNPGKLKKNEQFFRFSGFSKAATGALVRFAVFYFEYASIDTKIFEIDPEIEARKVILTYIYIERS